MRFIYFFLCIGLVLILYLSWQPSYEFKHIWFIPKWVSQWTDIHANGNIRTAVPFVFMGFCAGFLPSPNARFLSSLLIKWLILIGIVTIAEAGQLLIPTRYFSYEDIGWGATGALVGLVTASLFAGLLKKSSTFRK